MKMQSGKVAAQVITWSGILDEFKNDPHPVILGTIALILAARLGVWVGLINPVAGDVFSNSLDDGLLAVAIIWAVVRHFRSEH